MRCNPTQTSLETKISSLLLQERRFKELILPIQTLATSDQTQALLLQDSSRFSLKHLDLLLNQFISSLPSFLALEGAVGSCKGMVLAGNFGCSHFDRALIASPHNGWEVKRIPEHLEHGVKGFLQLLPMPVFPAPTHGWCCFPRRGMGTGRNHINIRQGGKGGMGSVPRLLFSRLPQSSTTGCCCWFPDFNPQKAAGTQGREKFCPT